MGVFAKRNVKGDLSCWVQTASVTLGALLSEELHYLVIALGRWKKRLGSDSKTASSEKVSSAIHDFSEDLQTFFERILHYLGLVNEMKTEKVVQNILLLLGAMRERDDASCSFHDTIKDKDLESLALFMEGLDLSAYEQCSEWDFLPSAKTTRMEECLLSIFDENKAWAQKLMQMAKELLSSLQSGGSQ